MDDIRIHRIDAGDGDGAEITFSFNDQLMAVSIFPGSSPSQKQSITNHLIDLLTQCTSPDTDDNTYEEIVDQALDIILDAGRAVFKVAASPQPSALGQQTLQSLLWPTRISFEFQETTSGDATVVPIDPSESYTDPSYAACYDDSNIESDIDDTLPSLNAVKIIVAEIFVAGASYFAGRVDLDGQELFCKAHAGGLTDARIDRELTSLHKLGKESHLRNDQRTRIPQLQGYVRDDTGRIIGFLRQWVPGRRLQNIDVPATSALRRRKWAAQIRDAIKYLHGMGVVWGDGKAGNIVIDEWDDAWLIDFGGGCTRGWVDEELADTSEGDVQAMGNIVRFLQVDDDILT